MSKDNYDDLADFCGPKDFYDLDGDGHIDAFEAAMMASDWRMSYGQANSTAAATHPRRRPTHPASPHRSRKGAAACLRLS